MRYLAMASFDIVFAFCWAGQSCEVFTCLHIVLRCSRSARFFEYHTISSGIYTFGSNGRFGSYVVSPVCEPLNDSDGRGERSVMILRGCIATPCLCRSVREWCRGLWCNSISCHLPVPHYMHSIPLRSKQVSPGTHTALLALSL